MYNFDAVALEHAHPAIACGISEYDGLLVAYLPKLDGMMDEMWDTEEGLTCYSVHGKLIDAISEAKGQRVKWWRVRNAARRNGLRQVEPIWQGPAGEFQLSCLPDLPRPSPDHTLYMRAYSHGPWVKLERTISGEKNENE